MSRILPILFNTEMVQLMNSHQSKLFQWYVENGKKYHIHLQVVTDAVVVDRKHWKNIGNSILTAEQTWKEGRIETDEGYNAQRAIWISGYKFVKVAG